MTRKKGMSIGASLRGRMADLLPDTQNGGETVLDRAGADKNPNPALLRTSQPEAPETLTSALDPLESFNTRLRQSTHRQLKVYCALNDLKIQDVVNEAITALLASKQE